MGIAGYASSVALGSASGNAGSNSIYLTKVVLPRNTTIGADAILLGVATAASGIQLKGLVYDNTGTSGSPGALKASSSVVTSAASPMTTLSFSSPVSLAAGTYYVGYVCNSTLSVDIDSSQTGSSWFVNGGQSVSSPANPLSGGSSQNNALSVALRYDSGSTLTGWMTDYSPGITLSSSNDVATHDSVNQIESCRSGVGNTSTAGGLYYAEVKVNSIGSNCRVGLGAAAFALDNATVLGAEYGTAGLDNTGTIHLPGSPFTVSIGLSYTSGDTLGIAYDANHNLIWSLVGHCMLQPKTKPMGPTSPCMTPTGSFHIQCLWAMPLGTAVAAQPLTRASFFLAYKAILSSLMVRPNKC